MYRIASDHVESFCSFHERLIMWGEYKTLSATIDTELHGKSVLTPVFRGFLNLRFIPRNTGSLLRFGDRMVLMSSCKTLLLSYRNVVHKLEATLYQDGPDRIEALYRSFREMAQVHSRSFERTGLKSW